MKYILFESGSLQPMRKHRLNAIRSIIQKMLWLVIEFKR